MKEAKKLKTSISCIILLLPLFVIGQIDNQVPITFENHLTKKKYNFSSQNRLINNDYTLLTKKPIIMAHNTLYNFDQLALFCKIEEKVSQHSKIAMRLRLGSLDYVDNLEQKPFTQYKN